LESVFNEPFLVSATFEAKGPQMIDYSMLSSPNEEKPSDEAYSVPFHVSEVMGRIEKANEFLKDFSGILEKALSKHLSRLESENDTPKYVKYASMNLDNVLKLRDGDDYAGYRRLIIVMCEIPHETVVSVGDRARALMQELGETFHKITDNFYDHNDEVKAFLKRFKGEYGFDCLEKMDSLNSMLSHYEMIWMTFMMSEDDMARSMEKLCRLEREGR